MALRVGHSWPCEKGFAYQASFHVYTSAGGLEKGETHRTTKTIKTIKQQAPQTAKALHTTVPRENENEHKNNHPPTVGEDNSDSSRYVTTFNPFGCLETTTRTMVGNFRCYQPLNRL